MNGSHSKNILLVGVSDLCANLARSFATNGSNIGIVSWVGDEAFLQAALAKSKEGIRNPGELCSFSGVLTKEDFWSKTIDTVVNKFGGLDLLIYFDGVTQERLFAESCLSAAKSMMSENFIAPVLAINSALPHLQKSKGIISILVSESAGGGPVNTALYTSSKMALETFVRKLRDTTSLSICLVNSGSKEYRILSEEGNIAVASDQSLQPGAVASIYKSISSGDEECFITQREQKKRLMVISGNKYYPSFVASDPTASPLSIAILNHNKHEVRELLKDIKRNPDMIIEADEHGRNALHYAAYIGHVETLSLLISKLRKKTLINSKDNLKWTPLHLAAKQGHTAAVKKLIKENGDPNALTAAGYSPLHFLSRFSPPPDNPKMIASLLSALKALIDVGADANQRNGNWETPVHEAADAQSVVAINFLLKKEGDVHRKTKISGQTPLMYAMKPGNREVIELLLKAGADPVDCFELAPNSITDLLEQYREKNRRPDDGDDYREREIIVVASVDDLPQIAKKLVDSSGLVEHHRDLVEQNWKVFLYILRFLTRKVYRTQSQAELMEPIPKREIRTRTLHGLSLEQATEKFVTNGNPRKLYKTIEDAGRGGFGSVYMAKRLEDKKRVAIKRVPHLTEREQWNNFDEIYFLTACAHSCVVKYYNSYLCGDEMWIIMEYLEGGSLQQAVSRYTLEEGQICYVTKEILRGIRAIHKKNMIHRDLKSANVMLSVNGDIKIIDFGLCVELGSIELINMVGSPFWIPPEMIQRKEHGPPADIWSLAILCLEMAHGKPPHRHSALKSMFHTGIGNHPWFDDPNRWSEEFKSFMTRMLKIDPNERGTAEELLQDPWLAKADTKKGMREVLHHIFIEQSLQTSLGIDM